jgi:hypothetical protein
MALPSLALPATCTGARVLWSADGIAISESLHLSISQSPLLRVQRRAELAGHLLVVKGSRYSRTDRQRFPELAERHAIKLDALAAAMMAAEQEVRATVANLSRTSVEERIARTELVRQLHKNRGALRALYPRNARRVASFFPPSHSRAAGEPEPEVEVDDAVVGQPAP